MNSKRNISKAKLQKIVQREFGKGIKFIKKYWFNTNDPLTLILKTNLYIEILLNEILAQMLPKHKKILEKRFADKIDVFEALAFDFPQAKNGAIVEKIRIINRLRNDFAHNLNKKLKLRDLQPLIKNIKLSPKANKIAKLKKSLFYILGYILTLKIINQFFPFMTSLIRNHKIFKKDQGYSIKKIAKVYYLPPKEEILQALKDLNL